MLLVMSSTRTSHATSASEPDDQPNGSAGLPIFDLPPADTKRWVVRRKAIVVAAVRSGALSIQEACRRYTLSLEEFLAWQRAIEQHGVPGLRVTRLQIYRGTESMRTDK
jgi:hypothetical protein